MNTTVLVALIGLGGPLLVALGALLNNVLSHRFGRSIKLENGTSLVKVEEVRDRHSFAADQAVLIDTLNAQCSRLQERLDKLTDKNIDNSEKIAKLTGKVEEHSVTISRMGEEANTYKLDCEKKIAELTSENVTLRTQNSTLIGENSKLAAEVTRLGGDVKDTLAPTRRKEDKEKEK